MSDEDRTAIHEVMEQGRITVNKAAINVRLNARCSVLAAANPVDGCYNPYKHPMDNIGYQDSLLSRFDLLHIILDEPNRDNDARVAECVLKAHRYRAPGELDGESTVVQSNVNLTTRGLANAKESASRVFEKHNPMIQGEQSSERVITTDFLRRYIYIAKLVKPELTEKVCLDLGVYYSNLRRSNNEATGVVKVQPVTARTLETLIRLSTAHAKARSSKTIEAEDTAEAINLVERAYHHEVARKYPAKRKRLTAVVEDNRRTSQSNRRDIGEGEERPSLTEEEKERSVNMQPDFLLFLSQIARSLHGATVLDVDMIRSEAIDGLNSTGTEP